MPAPGRRIEVDYDRDDVAALLALYDSWAHPDRAYAPTADDLARVRRHLEKLDRGEDIPLLQRLVRDYAAAMASRDLSRIETSRYALFREIRETEIKHVRDITDLRHLLKSARQFAAIAAVCYSAAGVPVPGTIPPIDPDPAA
jgi:hypothetical protein